MFDKSVCMLFDKRFFNVTIHNELDFLDMNFFICGDGKQLPWDWYNYIDLKDVERPQAVNYANCLKAVLANAKASKLKNLFFCEDDAEVNRERYPNYKGALELIWEEFQRLEVEWDMLYLGGNIQCATQVEAVKISDRFGIAKANYILDMHATVFNESSFDKILKIASCSATIDGLIADRHKDEIKAYTVYPVLITQKDGFSYNENCFKSRKANHIL